jgi:hypothetical protein
LSELVRALQKGGSSTRPFMDRLSFVRVVFTWIAQKENNNNKKHRFTSHNTRELDFRSDRRRKNFDWRASRPHLSFTYIEYITCTVDIFTVDQSYL